MTLGQTRQCCNGVTRGAPPRERRHAYTHSRNHRVSGESPGRGAEDAPLSGHLSLQPISLLLLSAPAGTVSLSTGSPFSG